MKRVQYLAYGIWLAKHCRSIWKGKEVGHVVEWTITGKEPMRDFQRKKMFSAETSPYLSGKSLTIQEAKALTEKIWASAWKKSNFPDHRRAVKIEALSNRVKRWGGLSFGGRIQIGNPTDERILLHELAHELSPAGEKHGPIFACTFLALIERWHSGHGFPAPGILKAKYGIDADKPVQLLRSRFQRGKVKVGKLPGPKLASKSQSIWSPELGRWYTVE